MTRPTMAHAVADLPPRLAAIVKIALGLGVGAIGIATTALTVCLTHGP